MLWRAKEGMDVVLVVKTISKECYLGLYFENVFSYQKFIGTSFHSVFYLTCILTGSENLMDLRVHKVNKVERTLSIVGSFLNPLVRISSQTIVLVYFRTPLILATMMQPSDIVTCLVRQFVDIRHVDDDFRSALWYAKGTE